MDVSPSAADAAPTPIQTPQTATVPARDAAHPLLWAALLVWLSVEGIGEGLRALGSVLASASRDGSHTPTPTPS